MVFRKIANQSVFVAEINKLSACMFEETMSLVDAESSVKKSSRSVGDFGVGAVNKFSQFIKFVRSYMLGNDSMETSATDGRCGTSEFWFRKTMLLGGTESVVKTSSIVGGAVNVVE